MDENLGTLSFSFKADPNKWRESLAELDRMTMEFRRRVETPVGVMAGGGGGGGYSVGSGRGPNIGGTSNGDVTWKLQQAVARSQASVDAVSVGVGTSRATGGSPDAELMRVARQAKRDYEFGERVKRIRQGDVLQNAVDTNDMRQKQAIAEDKMWRGIKDDAPASESASGGSGSKTPWYRSRLMLRGIIGVQVVDAIASELNNEENYKKAARLAGNDSGAQSSAVLARTRGAYEAIPLVGGIAYNAMNGLRGLFGYDTEQSIETDNALAQQQLRYQDTASGLRLGATSTRLGAQALLAGNSSYGSSLRNQQSKIGRDAAYRASTAKLYADAGFEDESGGGAQHYTLSQYIGANIAVPGVGFSMAVHDLHADSQAETQANEAAIRNAGRRNLINAQLSPVLTANRAMDAAEEQDRKYTNLNTIDLQQNQLRQGDLNAKYLYTAGSTSRTVGDYKSAITDAQRRGMDDSDRSILYNRGALSVQDLQQQGRDVMDNYRYGSAQQFDPFVQSTYANMDRGSESIGDKIDTLNAGMAELTIAIKTLSNGGSGGGAPH